MSNSSHIAGAAGVAIAVLALAGDAAATALRDLPPGAHAGECFSRTVAPPVYRTDHVTVPTPPLVGWRDIPAVYKTVVRQVIATPARIDRQSIPDVTGTRVRWVEHPGADRVVESPAVYRWVETRVLVRAAHLEWRSSSAPRGFGPGSRDGVRVQPTGEVQCRVLVPARYAVHRVRILVRPSATCIVKGPFTRERVVEHFVVTAARVVEHPVAATYRTVSEQVLVTPARRERTTTPQPPRYEDRSVEIRPASTTWTRIDCKVPPTTTPRPVHRPAPRPHGYVPVPLAPSYGAPEAQPQPQPYGQPYHPDYAPIRPEDGSPRSDPGVRYHAPSVEQLGRG